jgi:hypothetical protein
MANYNDIAPKFKDQVVYLENTFDQCVMKCLPGENAKTYIKFKGQSEWIAKNDSDLVAQTMLEAKEITEKQYKEY